MMPMKISAHTYLYKGVSILEYREQFSCFIYGRVMTAYTLKQMKRIIDAVD